MAGYEHVQKMRDEARQMPGKELSEAGLKKAAAHLEAALAYLARPDIRELATGNVYLYYRGHDVRLDLAGIYSEMGEKEKALKTLEDAQHFAWLPQMSAILSKPDAFTNLREEPRFKALLANHAIPERLWKVPAIATSYKEELSVEERVAGLSLFWAEARHGFVYFDHATEIDWDKIYMEYLTKVIATQTTRDYYRVMMQLAPLLHDGHTNIYPPNELADVFYSRPPLRTARIEDKVVITALRSVKLGEQLRVGDEIVSIDDMPVMQYALERVAPYVSSSTPQDRTLRMFTYQLFAGDAAKPLNLRLRDAAGKERTEIVARTGYTDVKGPAQFQFKLLPNGVAYISLDHFESNAGVKAFEAALPEIMKAKGLVIDIRQNGGGSTNHGLAVLSYLSKQPIGGSISYRRGDNSFDRARGQTAVSWVPLPDSGRKYQQVRAQMFDGPVAILTGAQSFSAAEDFVVAFESMRRGITIGEATGGSTGQPLSFKLPGGGTARICVKRDVYEDGREFVGKGIRPDIEVKPDVDDIRSGRDPVLERAAAEVLKRG
jgi:C-terminal processing protease CtpA/Prc